MEHDGEDNNCSGSSRIMAPSLGGQAELFLWSTCSAETLQTYIKYTMFNNQSYCTVYDLSYCSSELSTCLDDLPTNTQFKVNPNELPGLNYTADDQCRAEYGPSAQFCPFPADMDPEIIKLRIECKLCSKYLCLPTK